MGQGDAHLLSLNWLPLRCVEAIQDFPVQSAICEPKPHSEIVVECDEDEDVGTATVRGYALAGGVCERVCYPQYQHSRAAWHSTQINSKQRPVSKAEGRLDEWKYPPTMGKLGSRLS
jgi:hypothetical protein